MLNGGVAKSAEGASTDFQTDDKRSALRSLSECFDAVSLSRIALALCRQTIFSEMLALVAFLVSFSIVSLPVAECRTTSSPAFTLAAGVSAATEQCIVAAGAHVSLSNCAKAVAAGDGSDIWSFSDGQLVSAATSKCMVLLGGDITGGGRVGLAECDSVVKAAGSQWEVCCFLSFVRASQRFLAASVRCSGVAS